MLILSGNKLLSNMISELFSSFNDSAGETEKIK